ncbi:CHAP domain-containing protein [Clostridium sp. AF19-22AC]|jgi:hypothetical protein|uniref:lysozyme family protein n=1 Tax=Clostridia TaxID=186801 RepID=UPI000E534D39|nr:MULTISPECIES: lysozyme family protein [Clostridia]RHR25803.1 CHAP domain-containing protein [Clostridium sp. AF19-22AC]
MRDIKMKEHNRSPKLKNPAARMPKEFVRSAALEMKEKQPRVSQAVEASAGQESPVQYGSEKLTSAEGWAAYKSGSAVSAAGRKAAKKSFEKLWERRKEERTAETAAEASETAQEAEEEIKSGLQTRTVKAAREQGKTPARQGSSQTQTSSQIKVRIKPEAEKTIRTSVRREVNVAPRVVKSSPVPYERIKTSKPPVSQYQNLQVMRAARQAAVKALNPAETLKTAKTAKTTVRGIKTAVHGVVTSIKALGTILASAGGGVVFLIIILGVIGGALFSGSSQSAEPLSQEVLNYTPVLQRYASEYGIPEYVASLQAIMMQESGGRGNDPMQSSECPFNTRFPNTPNAITEPEYSIQVGVQYYAACVQEAGCITPSDMGRLELSWQGYNYGNGYISWALRNYGGYTQESALRFSQEQAASHGWSGYGDPEYVPHVRRYYSGGNIFAGLFGNEQIVTIAKTQIGNKGGQKFWSWYGYSKREEWCACFVSWCADQCGLITSGSVPKFSYCPDGIKWFKSQGRWKDRGTYTPVAGTIIFFDWLDKKTGTRDGISDHVGIVEKCENGIVYTIEGNSSNACKENQYAIDSQSILGYGELN